MELNQFTEQIEIKLTELPDVVFFCRRPKLEEVDSQSGAKRIKTIWSSNVQNWEGLEMDGKPFPCTSENKKKLLELNSLLVMAVCNKLADTWTQEFKLEQGN